MTAMKRVENKERVFYYDNLRAGLIFLVVLGHFLETATCSSFAPYGRMLIYFFHMPLFIFVSGVFFDIDNKTKAHRRAIIFFVIFVLMRCVSWVMNAILYHSYSISLFNINGMPWFMFALAIWNIITPYFNNMNKSVLLGVGIVFSLVVGYDDSINSQFALSRIIVFWPFFLLGTMVDSGTLEKLSQKKFVKIVGLIVLIAASIIVIKYYDSIKLLNPLLSGQNPYSQMSAMSTYGCFFRLGVYIIELVMSISFMLIIPRCKTFFSYVGERTISIYFFDLIVYYITVYAFADLHFYTYVIISVALVFILSSKLFYMPLEYIMKHHN